MSKIGKLLEAFENGAALTSKQISSRFRLKNATAAIHDLRQNGYTISASRKNNGVAYFSLNRSARRSASASSRAVSSR